MIELTVPDMTCGHCEKTIRATIARLDASAKVSVDLASKTIRVETSRPADELRKALGDEGYPPAA